MEVPDEYRDLDEVLKLFVDNSQKFVKVRDVIEDVQRHFLKVTRKYKVLSENYKKAAIARPFRMHYKLRNSYALARLTQVKRRDFNWLLSIVSYVRTGRGTVYYVRSPDPGDLTILSGHSVDRFIERSIRRDKGDRDISFDLALSIILEKMDASADDAMSLLWDRETNTIYRQIEDGYLVGNRACLGIENNNMVATFYKTFLSHNEISESKGEMLLKLYRERKANVSL